MKENLFKKLLSVLSSPIRIDMIKILSKKSVLSFTEIIELLGLSPRESAGKISYHINQLKEARIVDHDKESGRYRLTRLGEKVAEILLMLEDASKEFIDGIFVRTSGYEMEKFDRNKITMSLIREAGMPPKMADEISREAEERILKSKIKYLTAPLIREFVNAILLEKGFEEYRHALTRLGLPVYDVTQLIEKSKSSRNSSPVALKTTAGSSIFEQYLLLNVLPREVADAHLSGEIFIPYLSDWVLAPLSFQHNLQILLSWNTLRQSLTYKFPDDVKDLPLYLYTVLKRTEEEISRAQGIDFFNVFLAPFVRNMNVKEIEDLLYRLFFLVHTSMSKSKKVVIYLEMKVPEVLAKREVPNVGFPKIEDSVYGDYETQALQIFKSVFSSLKRVFRKVGPAENIIISVKLRANSLNNEETAVLLSNALEFMLNYNCDIIFTNLSPEWQQPNTNYCVDGERLHDPSDPLKTVGTGCVGWVAVNLLRAAYESSGDESMFFEKIKSLFEKSLEILSAKVKYVKELLSSGILRLLGTNLHSNGKEKRRYFELNNALLGVAPIGIPEVVRVLTNEGIIENKEFVRRLLLGLEEVIRETSSEITERKQETAESHLSNTRLMVTTCVEVAKRFAEIDRKRQLFKQGSGVFYTYSTGVLPNNIGFLDSEYLRLVSETQRIFKGGYLLPLNLRIQSLSVENLIECIKTMLIHKIGAFSFTNK